MILIGGRISARTGSRPISTVDVTSSFSTNDAAGESFFNRLSALSSLLARVLGSIYSRTGLQETNNGDLLRIRDHLKSWKSSLPIDLRLANLASSIQAGLLHLLYTTVMFLLYRPFMRWSFFVECHFDIDLELRVWEDIRSASTAGLEWVTTLPDLSRLLGFGSYPINMASFLQYHSWARRREAGGVMILDKVHKAIGDWTADDKLAIMKEVRHGLRDRIRPLNGRIWAGLSYSTKRLRSFDSSRRRR